MTPIAVEKVNRIMRTWRANHDTIYRTIVPERYAPDKRSVIQVREPEEWELAGDCPPFNANNVPVEQTITVFMFQYVRGSRADRIECEGIIVWERWY